MATITQNDITFNSVKTGSLKFSNWPLTLLNQQGPDEDGGIINAVEIDWNGAQWPNLDGSSPSTINTTGDLIKTINNSLYS